MAIKMVSLKVLFMLLCLCSITLAPPMLNHSTTTQTTSTTTTNGTCIPTITQKTESGCVKWWQTLLITIIGGIIGHLSAYYIYRLQRRDSANKDKDNNPESNPLLPRGRNERLNTFKKKQKEKMEKLHPLAYLEKELKWTLRFNELQLMQLDYQVEIAVVDVAEGRDIDLETERVYQRHKEEPIGKYHKIAYKEQKEYEDDFSNIFKNKNTPGGRDGPGQLVLILGDAGTGKTTCAYKQAYDWSIKEGFDDFVVYLPIRLLHNCKSIDEMLKHQWGITLEDLSDNRGSIILDGLDELDVIPDNVVQFIQGQSKFSSTPKKIKLIIMSRPDSKKINDLKLKPDVKVKFQGAQKDEYKSFIERFFRCDKEDCTSKKGQKAYKAINILEKLYLTIIPFYVILVCLLVEMENEFQLDSNDIPETRTSLFNAFMAIRINLCETKYQSYSWYNPFKLQCCVKRSTTKYNFKHHPLDESSNIPPKIKNILTNLAKLCHDYVAGEFKDRVNNGDFSSKILDEYKVDEQILQKLGIFGESVKGSEELESNCKASDRQGGSSNILYVVRHRLFIEYLAGLHMVNTSKILKMESIGPGNLNCIKFACGMSCSFLESFLESSRANDTLNGSPTVDCYLSPLIVHFVYECYMNHKEDESIRDGISTMFTKYLTESKRSKRLLCVNINESTKHESETIISNLTIKMVEKILKKLYNLKITNGLDGHEDKTLSTLGKQGEKLWVEVYNTEDESPLQGDQMVCGLLFGALMRYLTFQDTIDAKRFKLKTACNRINVAEILVRNKENFDHKSPVFPELECLIIEKCHLYGDTMTLLQDHYGGKLKELQLDLHRQDITFDTNFPCLEYLAVSLAPAKIDCQNLRCLSIADKYCSNRKVVLEQYDRLKHLHLHLWYCNIEDMFPMSLTITYLDVCCKGISQISNILQMSSLEVLKINISLFSNPVVEDDVKIKIKMESLKHFQFYGKMTELSWFLKRCTMPGLQCLMIKVCFLYSEVTDQQIDLFKCFPRTVNYIRLDKMPMPQVCRLLDVMDMKLEHLYITRYHELDEFDLCPFLDCLGKHHGDTLKTLVLDTFDFKNIIINKTNEELQPFPNLLHFYDRTKKIPKELVPNAEDIDINKVKPLCEHEHHCKYDNKHSVLPYEIPENYQNTNAPVNCPWVALKENFYEHQFNQL